MKTHILEQSIIHNFVRTIFVENSNLQPYATHSIKFNFKFPPDSIWPFFYYFAQKEESHLPVKRYNRTRFRLFKNLSQDARFNPSSALLIPRNRFQFRHLLGRKWVESPPMSLSARE